MNDDHADFQIAAAHYRLLFPTLLSLGAGDPPATWFAEYERLVGSGFSASLVTGATGPDGAGVTGARNFSQTVLLRALHERRRALDEAYEPWGPEGVGVSDGTPPRLLGIKARIGGGDEGF